MQRTLTIKSVAERIPLYSAELLVAFLGIWGLYAQTLVALKFDFEFLANAVVVPALIFLGVSSWLWHTGGTQG